MHTARRETAGYYAQVLLACQQSLPFSQGHSTFPIFGHRPLVRRGDVLAAITDHDRSSFIHHAARALDIARTEPVADDHAVYGMRGYVAPEVASGFTIL